MIITAFGAANEVTGSNYLVETNGVRFLVDLGLFQGSTQIEQKNREPLPYSSEDIDFVLLTHAHIDHSGRLPLLRNFRGRIYMTHDTFRLLEPLLRDSASIQERSRNPLYSEADVEELLSRIVLMPYYHEGENAGIRFRFMPNGHLLGSAFIHIETPTKSVVFSGDMGRFDTLLYPDPAPMPSCDVLVSESTYATTIHRPMEEAFEELFEHIERSFSYDRTIVIPAFSIGRTSEILYGLHLMAKKQKKINEFYRMPIYMDSPLGIQGRELYLRGFERMNDRYDPQLLYMPNLSIVSGKESYALDRDPSPKIIISSSGMVQGGHIIHHLRTYLAQRNATVIFVGYQGEETNGRKIQNREDYVVLDRERVKVHAKILTVDGFSGHADKEDLRRWMQSADHIGEVLLAHGEEDIIAEYYEQLRDRGRKAHILQRGVPVKFR